MNLHNKEYYFNLDGLRFFMCLGIAIFHLGGYFFAGDYLYIKKFSYFTDIFFVISAFLLTRLSYKIDWNFYSYRIFFFRRFFRIYPLYFLTLLFYIMIGLAALYGLVTPDNPDKYDFSHLLAHLLLLQSWGGSESLAFNYVAWALSCYLLMYLILPPLIIIAKKNIHYLIWSLVIILLAAEFISLKFFSVPLTLIQTENFGILGSGLIN